MSMGGKIDEQIVGRVTETACGGGRYAAGGPALVLLVRHRLPLLLLLLMIMIRDMDRHVLFVAVGRAGGTVSLAAL